NENPEPMVCESSRLSQEGRRRRFNLHLCISCGTMAHHIYYNSSPHAEDISLLCMVFFLIVVIYKMFQIPCPLPLDVINMTVNSTVAQMNSTVCMPKYFFFNSQTVYAVPILTFAFVCHPAILPMYEELRDRSRMKMQNVANVSFFAMFVMYLLAALFGYLTFNNAVESELLHTYSKVYRFDVVLLIVRLAVLTAVTLSVPVVLFPIRTSVNHLLCASRVQLSGVNVFVIFESMMSVQKIGAAVFLASGFIVIGRLRNWSRGRPVPKDGKSSQVTSDSLLLPQIDAY
uniref:Sodium-coupled neutral amino acid symporter 2 n=1 Tax=Pygocentrus nattereri TaxID=42514 RepID=A0A3B4CS65_PYGNA